MTEGLGRWIYCKYCDKNVTPTLGGLNQVICPECNSGLTPDFHSYQELKKWVKQGGQV